MQSKHRQILDAIFAIPVPANIAWSDIIGLFRALGAELSEGRGSRVRVSLNNVDAVFHRPRPRKKRIGAQWSQFGDFSKKQGSALLSEPKNGVMADQVSYDRE